MSRHEFQSQIVPSAGFSSGLKETCAFRDHDDISNCFNGIGIMNVSRLNTQRLHQIEPRWMRHSAIRSRRQSARPDPDVFFKGQTAAIKNSPGVPALRVLFLGMNVPKHRFFRVSGKFPTTYIHRSRFNGRRSCRPGTARLRCNALHGRYAKWQIRPRAATFAHDLHHAVPFPRVDRRQNLVQAACALHPKYGFHRALRTFGYARRD